MLDTLTLADRLTEAGVQQKQANAIAHAIHDAQGNVATKADIQHLATKADLERFATKADLEHFATKADLQQVRADIYRVIMLQTAGLIAAIGTMLALLRFLD